MSPAAVYKTSGPNSKVEFVPDYPDQPRAPGQVRIRVSGSSYNPFDGKFRRHLIGNFRPAVPKIPGLDFAGVVEEAESGSKFKSGDRVYGMKSNFFGSDGTWTTFNNVSETELTFAPRSVDLVTAGVVPAVSLTALQALERCKIKPGDRVLVHAGSGGVGHVLVQLAKNFFQAYVVTTSRQIEFCKSIGADEVVDYTKEDFSVKYADQPFNAIVDIIGGDAEAKGYALLAEHGVYSYISNDNDVPGRKEHAQSTWKNKKYETTFLRSSLDQLDFLAKLIDEGKLKPHIGLILPLERAGEAEEHLSKIKGKVAIKIEP